MENNNIQELLVFRDWVYYCNGWDGLTKTDGTEEYCFTEERAIMPNICNDEVVYEIVNYDSE